MKKHFLKSSFREKLIEHRFIGELLKQSWCSGDCSIEISKPEVDNQGYDLIAEANGIIRHIQLKTSHLQAKAAKQKVHVGLAGKPSGCVIWIYFDQTTLELGPFLFFGNQAGEPLPDLSSFKISKHTKADLKGVKKERPDIREVPKRAFRELETVEEVFETLIKTNQSLKEPIITRKNNKSTVLEKTAYHEAGHAVAAYLNTRSFNYVSIVPNENEGSLGHVMYRNFSDKFNPEVNADNATRNTIEKIVMCSLAGPIAEKLFAKRYNHVGARGDYNNAHNMSCYICGSDKEIEIYLKWLWLRTENALKNPVNWSAVKALAEALLKENRIGAKKAREKIKRTIREYFDNIHKPAELKIIKRGKVQINKP